MINKQENMISAIKKSIPKAVREQVWITYFGKKFDHKCHINWCKNKITVFDFECGHNIPSSKGGNISLENLRPICSRCNKSMSNNYTIDQWQAMGKKSHCTIL